MHDAGAPLTAIGLCSQVRLYVDDGNEDVLAYPARFTVARPAAG